jgi:hypothetical protein
VPTAWRRSLVTLNVKILSLIVHISASLHLYFHGIAMENPMNTIADAFNKLKQSISEDDAYDFASTELKDVWQVVRDIDSVQRQRQSVQNLRRIEPLLRGIEKYAKVIEVLCNGTPYMPYVWACLSSIFS